MVGVLSSEHTATASAAGVHHGAVSQKSLIRLLVTLKWTLWKCSYRKNIGKLVGTILGGLYALGGLVGLVFAFLGATLWSGEGDLFPMIIRGLGALTVLLWFLIPVLAFGLDDTLDPRRFALFPRNGKELQPGLLAAAMLGLPSLFTLVALVIATAFEVLWLVLFGQGVGWIIAALVLLIPANLAGLALCLLLPRAWFAHSASRASSRSGRELGGIIGMLAMFAVIYGFSLGMQKVSEIDVDFVMRWLPTVIDVLTWTPFGALFAVPMDLAEGHVVPALLRLAIGAATIALTWLWWRRSLDASLTSALTGDASSGTTKVSALVPRFVKPSAFGAMMGKSLRYWRRDTRYLAAIGIYPLIIVFLVAMGMMLPESRSMMLGMVVLMCGISGITLCNEIGFDGPSGWVNITANVPARANLLGRVAAMALLMVPPVIVISVAMPLLYGLPDLIPLVVLASLGTMGTGWGVSVAIGAILPYPASAPGTNPMKDKSASSTNAMLTMTIAMVAVFVPQIPTVGLAIWGLVVGSDLLLLVAGILSLAVGIVAFLVGLRIGVARLTSRYPDLFQKVRDFL